MDVLRMHSDPLIGGTEPVGRRRYLALAIARQCPTCFFPETGMKNNMEAFALFRFNMTHFDLSYS